MKQETQERRQMWRITALAGGELAVVVLVAMLLAYVGVMHGLAGQTAAPSTLPSQPQPTSVHIVRIPGNTPTFKIDPLDRTITDESQVQHLYETSLHLPGRTLGGACGVDPEAYVLTFYRTSQVLLTMQAHTGLCEDVVLDRGNPDDPPEFIERTATPAFWAELAHVLRLPPSDVEPISDLVHPSLWI